MQIKPLLKRQAPREGGGAGDAPGWASAGGEVRLSGPLLW